MTAILTAWILLSAGAAFSQDRTPERGYQAGQSYSISDIENVNLTNGNLLMNIPLATLPAGRGSDGGFKVTLRYNSKLWDTMREDHEDGTPVPDVPGLGYGYSRNLLIPGEQAGWKLDSGGYVLMVRNRLEQEPEKPCNGPNGVGEAAYIQNGFMWRVEMRLPDGSVKEFRPYGTGYSYNDLYNNGYFEISPFGKRVHYTYQNNSGHITCPSLPEEQITTAGMNYYAADGSGMRLYIPYNGSNTTDHWKLYYPNGTLIEDLPTDDPTLLQRQTDRNENKIKWKNATVGSYSGVKIENDAGPDGNGSRLNSGNSIKTSTDYDACGSPTLTTDAGGTRTQITYNLVTDPNGRICGFFPIQTVAAYGTPVARTSAATYDFYTGRPLTSTDVDNNLTNAVVYDHLGRAVKSITAQGTALESWTTTEYHDTDRFVVVRSDLETKGDGKKVATQFIDQLGRARLSKTLEDSSTQSATNETDGIKVQTRYRAGGACTFDPGQTCSFQIASNPYRAATSSAASSEPTMGWTRSQGASLGKHSETETFAGGSLPAPWGSNSSTTGKIKTDIDGNRALVTDQADKKRISKTNALGQLTDVWEVTGQDSDTESISFPNAINVAFGYKTSYTYGVLGNLASVAQGGQTRSFTYSSLSRLLTAANPESGTISYNYDKHGNLVQKSDAKNVVVSYTYDALNRITQRSYAGESGVYSTPMVTYEYDNQPHAKGKLTRVSSSISENQFTSFDILGRVLSSVQVTDGRNYAQNYTYNLSGALVEQEYPSLQKVKNVLNNDGSLSLVESKKNADSGYWTYANSLTYTPAGTVSSLQLGNGHWESTAFNSRLQPINIALGSTTNSADALKLDYSYGTNQNNGNVQSQTITVPVPGSNAVTFTQSYQYDSLNRIKQATETSANQPGWQQTFVYDRYGNRRFDTSQNRTTTLTPNCPTAVCNPEASTMNNRLIGAAYDSAGNTTVDGASQQYVYDGENKMVAAKDASGNLIGQYWYDGDGKRVKKYVPSTGEVTVFVYDTGGKIVEEYSTKLSDAPQVAYVTNDNLGSPRINTNAYGAVIARHDYHPFGEEIIGDGRTQGIGYGADQIRKKFAGYERDEESNLDFAQARYFNSAYGRFISPDPLYIEQKRLVNPQQLNLYSYVGNNPIKLVDPSGLDVEVTGEAQDYYMDRLQDGLSFKVQKNSKTNKVEIVDENGKVLSKKELNKLGKSLKDDGEKELFSAITDQKNHVVIDTVNESGSVDFGRFDGNGKNTIDASDLSVLDNSSDNGGFTSSRVVKHETSEAYFAAQNKGASHGVSHAHANEFFSGITPADNQAPIFTGTTNYITHVSTVFNIQNTNVNIRVERQFDTPVPRNAIPPTTPPHHIVDVRREQ